MIEPQQYILEEWDSMCAIANKERQGNCPLIEDEVIVEIHKYVGAQDKRIAELEQAIMSNCYDDSSSAGKRLMALVTKQPEVKP